MTLEELKEIRYNEIDETSRTIIYQGFVFDGKRFSMSLTAQINWSNILLIPDNIFPVPISTKDESVYYLSLANRQAFYLAAMNAKTIPLFSGNSLKEQIRLCQDEACVYAVVDNRYQP